MRTLMVIIALFAATATLFTPTAMAMRGVHHSTTAAAAITDTQQHRHAGAEHHEQHHQKTCLPQDMACGACMAMAATPTLFSEPAIAAALPAARPDSVYEDLRFLPPLPPPRA